MNANNKPTKAQLECSYARPNFQGSAEGIRNSLCRLLSAANINAEIKVDVCSTCKGPRSHPQLANDLAAVLLAASAVKHCTLTGVSPYYVPPTAYYRPESFADCEKLASCDLPIAISNPPEGNLTIRLMPFQQRTSPDLFSSTSDVRPADLVYVPNYVKQWGSQGVVQYDYDGQSLLASKATGLARDAKRVYMQAGILYERPGTDAINTLCGAAANKKRLAIYKRDDAISVDVPITRDLAGHSAPARAGYQPELSLVAGVLLTYYSVPRRFVLRNHCQGNNPLIGRDQSGLTSVSLPRAFSNITTVIAFVIQVKNQLSYLNLTLGGTYKRIIENDVSQLHPSLHHFAVRYTQEIYRFCAIRENLQLRRYAPDPNGEGGWFSRALGITKGWDEKYDIWGLIDVAKQWNSKLIDVYREEGLYQLCAVLEIIHTGNLVTYRPIVNDDNCQHLPPPRPRTLAKTYFGTMLDLGEYLDFDRGVEGFVKSLNYAEKNEWLKYQVYRYGGEINAFLNGKTNFNNPPQPHANMKPRAAMALYSRYLKQITMVVLALISMAYFGFTQGGLFFLCLALYYGVIVAITVLQSTHPRASNICPPAGYEPNYNIKITLMSYYHQDQKCFEPVNRNFNLGVANPTQTWDDFLVAYSNVGVFGILDDHDRLVLYTRGAVKEYGFVWYYAMNTVMGQPHIQLAYLWPADDPEFEYPTEDIQHYMDGLTSRFPEFTGDALETTVTLQSGCVPVYEDSWFIFVGRSITPAAPNKVISAPVVNELYQFALARPEVLIESITNIYKQAKTSVIQQLDLFNALNLTKGRPLLWRLPSVRTMLLSFAAAFTLAMRESLPKMASSVLAAVQSGFSSLMSTIHTMYCSILETLGFQECRLFVAVPRANTQASLTGLYSNEDRPQLCSYPEPSAASTPFFDDLANTLARIDTTATPHESSAQLTPTSISSHPPVENEPTEPESPIPQNSGDQMTEDTSASSNQNPSPTLPTELPNKQEPSTTYRPTLTLEWPLQSSDLKNGSSPTSQLPKEDPHLKSLVTIRSERLDIAGPVPLTFQLSTQVCQRDYESGRYEPSAISLLTLIPQIYSTTLGACRPMNSTSQAASTQANASQASSQSSSSVQHKNNSSQKESSSSTSTRATTTSSSTMTPLYPRSSAHDSHPSDSTSGKKTKLKHPRRGMSNSFRATTHEFMTNLFMLSALWLCMILFGAWPSLMLAACLLVIRHSTPGLPLSLRTFAVVTVISLCSAPFASAFSFKNAFSSAKSTLTSTFGASNPSETPSTTEKSLPSPNPQPICEYGSMQDMVFPPICKYELNNNPGHSFKTGLGNFWRATKSVASASWDYIAESDIVADAADVVSDLTHSRTATKMMNAATTVAETVSNTASTIKQTIVDTYDKTTSTVSSKINTVKETISETKQKIQDSAEKTAATVDYLYNMMPTLAYNEGYVVYVNTQVGPLVRSDALNVDLTIATEDGRPSLTVRQSLVTTFTMVKSNSNNNNNNNNANRNTQKPKAKKQRNNQRLVPRLGYRQRFNVTKDPFVPFMRTVLDPAHAAQYNATAAPLSTQSGYVLRHYVNEFAVPAQHRTKVTDVWYFLPDSAAIDAFMVYKITDDSEYHTAVLRNPSDDFASKEFWSIAKSITLTHMGPAKDRGGIFYGHRAAIRKGAAGNFAMQVTRPLYSTTNLSGIYATNELSSLPKFAEHRSLQSTVKYTILFPDGSSCTCPDLSNSDFDASPSPAFWTTVVHYVPPSVGYTGLTAKVCASVAVSDKTTVATNTYNANISMPILEVGLEAGLGFYPGSKNDLRQVLNTVRDFWKKNRTWIGAVSSLVPYGRNITAAIDALAQ